MKRKSYKSIVIQIKNLVDYSRENIARNINKELLRTYWLVGKLLVEKERTEKYNESSVRDMLIDLSRILTRDIGKGFSRSQLTYMRLFHLKFPSFPLVESKRNFGLTVSDQNQKLLGSGSKQVKRLSSLTLSDQNSKPSGLTVSDQLSWSHYYELLQCSTDVETNFYLQWAVQESWSVRDLRRQIDSSMFERSVLTKTKKQLKIISNKGKISNKDVAFNRDPYVLEFLDIPENRKYSERYLEQRIIDNLQSFILELGKGFTLVGRQFRITLANKHFYVDLVFYHRILKCFVLIDLKTQSVRHNDIGQMNLYLNYFEMEQNVEDDKPPIGIILSKQKDDISVEYAMKGLSSKIVISRYQLYLPNKKTLQQKVKELLA